MSEQIDNSNLSVRSEKPVKNPDLLARMVIREGKTFWDSALAAGYSKSFAGRGLAAGVKMSNAVSTAVKREQDRLNASLATLKPLAVRRLYDEIANPRSNQGIKAIELAGRFKETDWFVRNVDVQIGVFASLGERSPAEDTLEAYKDE